MNITCLKFVIKPYCESLCYWYFGARKSFINALVLPALCSIYYLQWIFTIFRGSYFWWKQCLLFWQTTSTASSEIQNTNNVVSSASAREYSQSESQYLASPPPPPAEFTKSEKFSTKSVVNEEDARTALLKAIQSGTGAARLRKV